jgi:hypothetical protein
MVVRGEGDVGRVAPATAPATFVPSHAHSYPPRSLVPPHSLVPPCSFVPLHSPRTCSRSFIPSLLLVCTPSDPLLPLSLLLMLRVHPRWLPGLCVPALCLSFSLWYLTCNRIVSFTVYFVLTFLFGFNIPTKQMNS